MKFFTKAFDVLLYFVLDCLLLSLTVLSVHLLVSVDVIADSLPVANGHVKLCYFMRVLAGGWDLNWALPVKITVAEGVGQLLNVNFPQL